MNRRNPSRRPLTAPLGARLAFALASFVAVTVAQAATLTVTTLADAGPGSLRAALASANANDTVVFAPALNGTIALDSNLVIDRSLTVDGDHRITLDGQLDVRVFTITASASVLLRALTIERGYAQFGGGIYNEGSLRLEHCRVRDNHVWLDAGGIIHYGPRLELFDTEIADNDAIGTGGGIYDAGQGETTITHSRITGNLARGQGGGGLFRVSSAPLTMSYTTVIGNAATSNLDAVGGGIHARNAPIRIRFSTITMNEAFQGGGFYLSGNGAVLVLDNSLVARNRAGQSGGGALLQGAGILATNSTFSGNSSGGAGGGLKNETTTDDGNLVLRSTTFTQNSAPSGGGIATLGSALVLANSLISGNIASTNPDVSGVVNSRGYNLVGVRGTSSGYLPTDLPQGSVASLGELSYDGGPTRTHPIFEDSAAIRAVPAFACFTPDVISDQRGFTRQPGACDIGAYDTFAQAQVEPVFAQGFE